VVHFPKTSTQTVGGTSRYLPRTIFRWADQGMITRHKINARVLFDDAEVVAFIESARVG
jgi:hypothetical protein